MREILFRGKRLDNGEWVEGYLAGYDLICTEEPRDVRHAVGEYYDQIAYVGFVEVDPSTVGQFTGLRDKNGKRVFEGDVLSLTISRPFEVKFTDGWFHMEGTAIPIKHAGKFRIIGNIHDGEFGGGRE